MKKKLQFLFSLVAMMLMATFAKAQITIDTDLTNQFASLTEVSSWTGAQRYTATNFCPMVTVGGGIGQKQVCERYVETCDDTGDIFYATVTGLTAGTYTIELYGGAAYTYGRGFTSTAFSEGTWNAGDKIEPSTEAPTGVTLYATTSEGEYGGEIPIYYAQNFPDGAATITLSGVVVGTNGQVKIGMSKSSTSTNWHVIQLKSVIATVDAEALLQSLLQKAQAALDDAAYAAVTGTERTALATAISENASPEATAEAYQAAITAVQNATTAFTNALAGYNAYANAKAMVDLTAWPYASADKKAAVEALMGGATSADDGAALLKAYRQFVESNALAEGVTGAVDMTDKIVNPTAAQDIASPWTVVKGEGSGGGLDVKNNEPWTDGSDNSTHRYFDGGDWGANSWDVSLVQEITLNPGRYMLTAIARASGDVAFSLFAGETKATIPAIGASGGVFDRGWNDAFVEFEVEQPSAVQIGVQGVVTPDHNHNWMSFSNFRLVQLEAGAAPTFTISVADTENGQVQVSPTEAAMGETVTVTVTPAADYMVDEVSLTYGEGQKVEFDGEPTANEGVLTATFTMPAGNVNVSFTFKKIEYDITVSGATQSEEPGAYLVEGGKISISSDAYEGEEVTIALGPDEGYEVESVSVTKTSDGSEVTPLTQVPDHQTNWIFIMPGEPVTVTAVFKRTSTEPVEPETPTYAATLTHTASSSSASDATVFTSTVDAEKEHVNNAKFGNTWAGAAYADFSVATLPAGASITKATLTFTAIGEERRARATDVLYVNAGAALDYDALATGTASADLAATRIQSVDFPQTPPTDSQKFEIDATEALNTILAAGQKNIIFKWTGNQGGGDVAGKASENAPTLIIEYMPGAPELKNPSFELADADTKLTEEQKADKAPLAIYGWTETIDNQFNNTEIRKAGSESTTSQFGTSDPSDGEYALFVRHGWNSNNSDIILTSDALGKIPAGDYTLSVDYKQRYSYDNTQNSNTKLSIALVNGETTLGSETSPAAGGESGGNAGATYFNTAEWSTLTASFSLAEDIPAGAQVVITLNARGQRRSDFFLDNVQFVKVPGVELALLDLEKAIEAAQAKAGTYTVGDGLFQYAASEIEPLTGAIATAQAAYNAAESKETVEAATQTLNNFVEGFAPTMTTPDAEQAYAVTNNTAPGQLSIADGKIAIADDAAVYFTAVEGGFVISNADGEYVAMKSGSTWSMTSTTDIASAYVVSVLPVEGGYAFKGANGIMGLDYGKKAADNVDKTVYANKSLDYNGVWSISEYVAPEIVLNAPTFNFAEGTQAEPNIQPTGSELKINFTADNLAVNGLTADDVKVKMTVLAMGDLKENLGEGNSINMTSSTLHRILPTTPYYIPLGETAFPAELKPGYVYQNIVVISAELVTNAEADNEEVVAAYEGEEPIQLHWVGIEKEPEPEIANLTQDMYHKWTLVEPIEVADPDQKDCAFGLFLEDGSVYGDMSVKPNMYADLTEWEYLTIAKTGAGIPRLIFNRTADLTQEEGSEPWKGEIKLQIQDAENEYLVSTENGVFVYDLNKIKEFLGGTVHLNCIKVASGTGSMTPHAINVSTIKPVIPTWYTISVGEGIENGTITATWEKTVEGAPVKVAATPEEGFILATVSYTAEGSEEATAVEGAAFDMPAANVTLTATFTEDPYEYTDLTSEMFHEWSAADGTATVTTEGAACDYGFGQEKGAGSTVYGNGNVLGQSFADLTGFNKLILTVESGNARLLMNVVGQSDPKTMIELNRNTTTKSYFSINGKTWTVDLDKFKEVENVEYVHLNAIKFPWDGSTGNLVADATLAKLKEEAPEIAEYTGVLEQTMMGETTTTENYKVAETPAGEGLVDLAIDGFTLPSMGRDVPATTIEGVSVTVDETGKTTYSKDPFTVKIPVSATVNFDATVTLEGEKAAGEGAIPVFHVTVAIQSMADEAYFGADQAAIDAYKESLKPVIADAYTGVLEQTVINRATDEVIAGPAYTKDYALSVNPAGEGTVDVTFTAFTWPVGVRISEFTIEGVTATPDADGNIIYNKDDVSIQISLGQMTTTYTGSLEGKKAAGDDTTPVFHLQMMQSFIDDIYFGANQREIFEYKNPELIEIAQTQDDEEGRLGVVTLAPFAPDAETGGITYTATSVDDKVCVFFKMTNVDVKGCDYILFKFADDEDGVPAGLSYAFWGTEANEPIGAGETELKYDIKASDVNENGIIPEVSLLSVFASGDKTVKVIGVYKHMIPTEKTIEIAVERYVGQGYAAQTEVADFTEALEFLGEENLTWDMLRMVEPDGTLSDKISNGAGEYDGWFNKDGYAQVWGENAFVCVKLSEAQWQEGAKYSICDMPDVPQVGDEVTTHWALVANGKTVFYNVKVTFVEVPEITFEVVKTIEIDAYDVAGTDYSGDKYLPEFDVDEVKTALNTDDVTDTYIVNVTTGAFEKNTTDGWRNADGDAETWSNMNNAQAPGYCLKLDDPASGKFNWHGAMYGENTFTEGTSVLLQWAIANTDNQAVLIKVTYHFLSESDFEIATGIDGIAAGGKAKMNGRKYMENGRVVIYRDGKKFTTTGTQLK